MEDMKMMLVMRRDLQMRKGKIAAQAGHAAAEAALKAVLAEGLTPYLTVTPLGQISLLPGAPQTPAALWLMQGQAKVCVYVDGEDALLAVAERAKDAGLDTALILDAGRTEFHGEPTYTCLAILPAPKSKVDQVTGELPLF